MALILNFKELDDKKIKCTLLLDIEETFNLQGNLKGVYLFSSDLSTTQVGIKELGIDKSSKYFEIPKKMMLKKHEGKNKIFENKVTASCQKIENEDKYFFIYIINKKIKSYPKKPNHSTI